MKIYSTYSDSCRVIIVIDCYIIQMWLIKTNVTNKPILNNDSLFRELKNQT